LRARDKSGYILVAVLGVMLVVTGLIASASIFARTALQSARLGDDEAGLAGLVQGGLEITAYQLFILKLPLEPVNGRRIRFGGGTITPAITDEASKIDINGANTAVLESTFRAAGMGSARIAELIARITEWRGVPSNGAPSPAQTAPAGGVTAPAAKHTGFRSVEDFANFAALDSSEVAALAPLLTVYNPDGKVNILTASRRVLVALPGMSGAMADDLIARRAHADMQNVGDVDRLKSGLLEQTTFIKTGDGPAYSIRIEAVSAAGRTKSGVAVVAKSQSPADPYLVFQWWD
jgi:general secretion pathway protein K